MTALPIDVHASMRPLPSDSSLTELLTRRLPRGILLQDLVPIAESISWLRCQRYWSRARLQVFTSNEVPNIVTNDGEQSRRAVEVYISSLRAAELRGCREPRHWVLELGPGIGLFAKLFLDQLQARSMAEGTDDYERTTYVVADSSPGLLEDTRSSGVFSKHEKHVVHLHSTARSLRTALTNALPEAAGAVRAVYANYLLDSLPFTILSSARGELYELHIRTRVLEEALRPGARPPPSTDAQLRESWLAEQLSDSRLSRSALVLDAEYVRVRRETLPFPDAVPVDFSGPDGRSLQLVHSFGSVECLNEVFGILRPDGYFVAADYGYDGPRPEPIEFQVFGSSISSGVNFPQLGDYARGKLDCIVGMPAEDPPSLQARLYARAKTPADVVQLFQALHSRDAAERADGAQREALQLVSEGRYEAARWRFEEAHRQQPNNWHLMEAIVFFLSYTLEEHAAGLEVAKRALEVNHLSPRLWNLLGDCHYGLEGFDLAESAYRRAAELNPEDVRARTNLAHVFVKAGRAGDALRVIGEALALDHAGDCRDELLSKQAEALKAMVTDHLRDTRSSMCRMSGHHALPGRSDK